jgi:hypothetical protein
MPATKASAKKKPVKKPAAKPKTAAKKIVTTKKSTPAKKSAPMKKTVSVKKTASTKKPKLVCGVCGYAVTVDKVCGCVEEHTLICCGKPMAKK